MQDCLFCKIISKEIPAEIVYEDDRTLAFKDIRPAAPAHILVIPKKHIPTLVDLQAEDVELMGHIVLTASRLADKLGVSEEGFRLVSNCKEAGGQTVFHIHFHLIGGRQMQWPPG
ncbi:histidine triad nucleotide-binding protein [Desulforamulus ruminis]|uniref:Histidine triad (HIT) protein n=1 Tax=Desulforamulus ruminis (strain ATCC 23193 / DSM 2154 / NCIMB 8452 / DL) TaxID=696281 RepID=F6DMV9_DESRL|nr:histidine triad nucleotide-binding protein [Desulforamulus ruminis]AEG59417.1 histidine triad (HIT) protein [Desulforamulus ruminis DSM 2154]